MATFKFPIINILRQFLNQSDAQNIYLFIRNRMDFPPQLLAPNQNSTLLLLEKQGEIHLYKVTIKTSNNHPI